MKSVLNRNQLLALIATIALGSAACTGPSTQAQSNPPEEDAKKLRDSILFSMTGNADDARKAAIEFVKANYPGWSVNGVTSVRLWKGDGTSHLVGVDAVGPTSGKSLKGDRQTYNFLVRFYAGEDKKSYWKAEPLTPANAALLSVPPESN